MDWMPTLLAIGGLLLVVPPAISRDISETPPDLQTPPMVDAAPAPGRRVRQVLPDYRGTQVYHALYLPADWHAGHRYPVIVEYAGNGPYRDRFGDTCTGRPEGSNLGYGISGGRGFLWICMPYVNSAEKKLQIQWWGDVPATLAYCRECVRQVCEQFGGDPSAVILTGFSRGAIGCGFLGLHDDSIADVWLAFIPYSHYDGVRTWNYPQSDRQSAIERLKRLQGRAQFICQEGSVDDTRKYLLSTGVEAPLVFRTGPFRNHNDAWVLRDVPERAELRAWLAGVLRTRPGTLSVQGRVTDSTGRPIAGARVQGGYTHWTTTDAAGRYELAGLVRGKRKLEVVQPGLAFAPREIELASRDLDAIDFAPAGPAKVDRAQR